MDLPLCYTIQLMNHAIAHRPIKADIKKHINAVSQVLPPASWVAMRYCQFRRIYKIMPHRLPEGRRHDKAKSNYTPRVKFSVDS